MSVPGVVSSSSPLQADTEGASPGRRTSLRGEESDRLAEREGKAEEDYRRSIVSLNVRAKLKKIIAVFIVELSVLIFGWLTFSNTLPQQTV